MFRLFSLIRSFSKSSLSVYCVAGIVLGAEGKVLPKRDKNHYVQGSDILEKGDRQHRGGKFLLYPLR